MELCGICGVHLESMGECKVHRSGRMMHIKNVWLTSQSPTMNLRYHVIVDLITSVISGTTMAACHTIFPNYIANTRTTRTNEDITEILIFSLPSICISRLSSFSFIIYLHYFCISCRYFVFLPFLFAFPRVVIYFYLPLFLYYSPLLCIYRLYSCHLLYSC